MKNVKIKSRLGKAVKIHCVWKGTIEEYALAWLHLTNNARENPQVFLKHYNNDRNSVFVVTPEKWAERVKDYLTGFTFDAEILDVSEVPTVTPIVDWSANWGNDVDYDEMDSAEVLPYEDAD